MDIAVIKLSPLATIPAHMAPGSAGFDLHTIESFILKPGERKLLKTGLAIAIPDGYYGRIAPRSGLAFNYGIDVLAGVIDASYRGEIGVILYNTGDQDFCIDINMRIAQMIIEKCYTVTFQEVETLDETARGEGGFGSTGI